MVTTLGSIAQIINKDQQTLVQLVLAQTTDRIFCPFVFVLSDQDHKKWL
ncbi:hypothetical protein EDC16_102202 [Testudinibacter aquarius]|uniref:Uncharacterized protein n=1 Tax=Testudinibacter aquarius TaxID=1524974 RepID=A0A4R3YAB1_9PAST|nr:hypothetical protein EDC16_102202 [Testudinibacter aquarius]